MMLRSWAIAFFLVAFPIAAQTAEPTRGASLMAATANPIASETAAKILRAGGSAVDAAVAGQLALAVVEPHASGLGGGGLMLIWDPAKQELVYLEGLAAAPAATPMDYAHDATGKLIDRKRLERSGRVVAVPGAVRLLELAHGRYGRLGWEELFEDAIALADHGFPLPRYLHQVLTTRRELARKPGFERYFDANGEPKPIGATIRNPDLAEALRLIAANGSAALETGPLAETILAAVRQGDLPGEMTAADLVAYRAKEREPVCLIAFSRKICSAAPPASGGISLLQQLALLDRLGIARQAPGGVGAAHLLLEASRLAYADRRQHLGDPDQIQVPSAGLLEAGYLDARAGLVSADQAMKEVRAGQPPTKRAALPASDPLEDAATTHLSIVDRDGGVVSFTTTNNLNFGSDLIAGGIVLNNAITNFATTPIQDGAIAANAAAPGKRPTTTMAPTLVFGLDGKPELIVGAGGGARIPDSVAQTIVGILAWGMNPRAAIEQPRIGAQNRAIELERGTAAADLADGLRGLGHEPKILDMNAGVQAVLIRPEGLSGWGDPRRDGAAAAD